MCPRSWSQFGPIGHNIYHHFLTCKVFLYLTPKDVYTVQYIVYKEQNRLKMAVISFIQCQTKEHNFKSKNMLCGFGLPYATARANSVCLERAQAVIVYYLRV